ncbi:hypothetical protein [Candidatus Poriferisodalis sp.]|uniref:hypothetical protein n=1 Tax=Candidatus Poriferisodalis sp. TaxID=3101277 RepID=UPI003B026B6A
MPAAGPQPVAADASSDAGGPFVGEMWVDGDGNYCLLVLMHPDGVTKSCDRWHHEAEGWELAIEGDDPPWWEYTNPQAYVLAARPALNARCTRQLATDTGVSVCLRGGLAGAKPVPLPADLEAPWLVLMPRPSPTAECILWHVTADEEPVDRDDVCEAWIEPTPRPVPRPSENAECLAWEATDGKNTPANDDICVDWYDPPPTTTPPRRRTLPADPVSDPSTLVDTATIEACQAVSVVFYADPDNNNRLACIPAGACLTEYQTMTKWWERLQSHRVIDVVFPSGFYPSKNTPYNGPDSIRSVGRDAWREFSHFVRQAHFAGELAVAAGCDNVLAPWMNEQVRIHVDHLEKEVYSSLDSWAERHGFYCAGLWLAIAQREPEKADIACEGAPA